MTMEKPTQTPILNEKERLNPILLALDIDIILLGPGVAVVSTAYDRKLNQLNIMQRA